MRLKVILTRGFLEKGEKRGRDGKRVIYEERSGRIEEDEINPKA